MKKSLKLIDWMIKIAKQEDLERRRLKEDESPTVGESWWVYHLKNLKELMVSENDDSKDNRSVQKEG